MESYFVPRAARYLLKTGGGVQNVHHTVGHQQRFHHQLPTQWTIFRNWRQSYTTRPKTGEGIGNKSQTVPSVELVSLPSTYQLSSSPCTKEIHRIGRKLKQNRNYHQKSHHEIHSEYQQCQQPSFKNSSQKQCEDQQKYNQQHSKHQKQRNLFLRWVSFLLRLAPVGICVFGAIEWKLSRSQQTATQIQTMIYCSLPLRMISRCWGWLASCYMPEYLRPYVYGWYARIFNVNLEEALYPDLLHYNTMAEFFTRPLKMDARPIDASAILVSPVDGKVLHFGSASESLVEQVKGVNYDIRNFLGPPTWLEFDTNKEKEKKDLTSALDLTSSEAVAVNSPQLSENCNLITNDNFVETIKHYKDGSTTLYQCVIYLAPGDYHRFHSPTDWEPTYRRHFHGELLSVNPSIASWMPNLFCLNERAVYTGHWKHGFFSYTAVGATNVGSLQIFFDQQLKTNRWLGVYKKKNSLHRQPYDDLKLTDGVVKTTLTKKGDLFGQFNMGSTIVLLFEAPTNFRFNLKIGQTIRMGEPLT